MRGKEKANSKQKRLFDTPFVQNGKEKSTHFIFYPDKNKRPLVFAILADVGGTQSILMILGFFNRILQLSPSQST